MSTSIKEKIYQDIHLLRTCLKLKHILLKCNSKSHRTPFWKEVQLEYNKVMYGNPKTIKQIRERFKYLYTNFEANHALEMKFNRNLFKGSFFENNWELISTLKETANECFHEMVYVNRTLVVAEDICSHCYIKQFSNLDKEDFVNPKPVTGNDMFDLTNDCAGVKSRITYEDVYQYECILRKVKKDDD